MKNARFFMLIVVFMLFFIIAESVLGEQSDIINVKDFKTRIPVVVQKKDPFIAGLLSWLMMGVGQIYCKEYTKGSIFMAADLIDKIALAGLVSYINKEYSPAGGETIYINWKAFDTKTRFLIFGYLAVKYGVKFYNVYDAVESAHYYNRIHTRNFKDREFSFNFTPQNIEMKYTFSLKE